MKQLFIFKISLLELRLSSSNSPPVEVRERRFECKQRKRALGSVVQCFVGEVTKVTRVEFMLTEVWAVTRMDTFKGKRPSFFYRRSETCLPWDPIETLGTRLQEGGEKGGLARLVGVTCCRRHVPHLSLCFECFHYCFGSFSQHRSYHTSHISGVEGFDLTDLIFGVFSSFCVVVSLFVIGVVVSPLDHRVVHSLVLEFGNRFKAIVWLGIVWWAELAFAPPFVGDLLRCWHRGSLRHPPSGLITYMTSHWFIVDSSSPW